jgi:hypothetical protein
MQWNGVDRWYTYDGTAKAWDKKTGNSAEINLILFHLLKQAGLTVYPMLVSTRNNGKVRPFFTFVNQFNRAVVYFPIDSNKTYILDATNKYNTYNEIPDELLNSAGFSFDKTKEKYDIIFLKKDVPVSQAIFVNAEISPKGTMSGTTQITSLSYDRINSIKRYKTDGEKKYIDFLSDNDNNLKISALKFENIDIDTLPLKQSVNFTFDLTGSDGDYIYFHPNIFTPLRTNEFLSEARSTDIEFGYLHNYRINGSYKIPAGYKIDIIPQNITMSMADNSISFRRIIGEQEGAIVLSYTISYKKPIYLKENYPEFHAFYKKMYEMLNEQIVLKKI